MADMEHTLVPVRIPQELESSFEGLSGVTIYFIDYILRLGRQGASKKKVVVVSSHAIFLCEPNGNINRCIAMRDVSRVIAGGKGSNTLAVVVREEGPDRMPSFDAYFRTGHLDYLSNVLRTLVPLRRRESAKPAPAFDQVPLAEDFPADSLSLHRPQQWVFRLDPDVLRCVAPPAAAAAAAAAGSVVHGGTGGGGGSRSPSREEAVAAARIQALARGRAVRRGAGGEGAPADTLRAVLAKLAGVEAELRTLKTAAPAARGAQELSLRSYDEVQRLKALLAADGLLPSPAHPSLPPEAGGGPFYPGLPAYPSPPVPNPRSSPSQRHFAECHDDLPTEIHAAPPAAPLACWACGRDLTLVDPLPRCSSCKRAVYCGAACQRAHWPRHKTECVSPAGNAAPRAAAPSGGRGGGYDRSSSSSSGGSQGSGSEDDGAPAGERPQQIFVVQAPPPVQLVPAGVPVYSEGQRAGSGSANDRNNNMNSSTHADSGGGAAPPASRARKRTRIPPPPPVPPAGGLPPDAVRDRVHRPSGHLPVLPDVYRPPPPPAPTLEQAVVRANPTNADYDSLFRSYREYYTNVLLGGDPLPPDDIHA
ncbi:hypothetical protein DIPPA_10274 [Diplonema papillatum]|nr:hypothetical protein DIPPA_10274 [Diplonema papillatum]